MTLIGHRFLILTVLSSALILISCSNAEENQVPENVLNQDQMTKLLIQIHIVESKTISGGLPLDTALVMYKTYYKRIMDSYKLDTATVNRSFKYYSQHPEATNKIYERVVDSLSLRNSTGNDRL